jgi:riboflavin synthase
MFTGIVEHLGTVLTVDEVPRGRTFQVDTGPLAADVAVGDSIAVNGVCLTAVSVAPPAVTFQVMGETLDRTSLGRLSSGDGVNLERPMAASGRFDGHIVQGHIDGVATVRSVDADGEGTRMWVDVAPELLRYVVEKGSVTLDGVSLTVAGVDDAGLEVALIPHTLAVTTLGGRRPGELVNVEVDVLAKYVDRLLGADR